MFKKLLIFIDDILHRIILDKKKELNMKITFDEIIDQVLEHEGG